jgi:plastocyanin
MRPASSRLASVPLAARAAIAFVVCATAARRVLPAHAAPTASSAPIIQVAITKFAFEPKDITVAPGTKVVWTNRDEAPHTVTSNDKSFASKGMDTDDTYAHTFASEGDFGYICTVHPFMTGVVHVRKP